MPPISKNSQEHGIRPESENHSTENLNLTLKEEKAFSSTIYSPVRSNGGKIKINKKVLIYTISLLVHILVLTGISVYSIIEKNLSAMKKVPENIEVVDIKEYIPAAPPEEVKSEKLKIEEDVPIANSPDNPQNVIKANPEGSENAKEMLSEHDGGSIDYLPQGKITELPVIPDKEIRSKIVYPTLANQQGIEGLVILELLIDKNGVVRNVGVLKDPGYGFAEAAVKAVMGIKCVPAKANGVIVPVKYRYPIRFTLIK